MAKSSSIALLQPPPAWALASSIASDRVLRQKWTRDEFGLTSTTTSKLNRHQRKNRLKQLRNSNGGSGNRTVCGGNSSIPDSYSSLLRSIVGGSLMTIINRARLHLIPNKNNHSSPNIRAIIASGSGPDGLAAARKSRKRRWVMVQSTAVIVLSMILMVVKQKWNNIKSVVREKGQADIVEGRHYPQMKGHVEDEIWTNDFEDQGGNDPSSESSSSCSSSSDNYSATFDNISGSNDSKDGAEDRNNEDMKASVDFEYDDLIPNSSSDEHEYEMATEGNACGISGSGRSENVSCISFSKYAYIIFAPENYVIPTTLVVVIIVHVSAARRVCYHRPRCCADSKEGGNQTGQRGEAQHHEVGGSMFGPYKESECTSSSSSS